MPLLDDSVELPEPPNRVMFVPPIAVKESLPLPPKSVRLWPPLDRRVEFPEPPNKVTLVALSAWSKSLPVPPV